MNINIPQYLRAEVKRPSWDDPYGNATVASVYLGETVVLTTEVSSYYEDEDAEMEAMSVLGEKLKKLIDTV